MKILYFDCETTGLDHKINDVIQFSALVEIDGKLVDEINIHMQPVHWHNVSIEALTVNGTTIEMLESYMTPDLAFQQIKRFLERYVSKFDRNDKFYPAGHNVQFDLDFMQTFWKRQGDKYGMGSYHNWRALDSRVFANFLLAGGIIDVPDVKLQTLCAFFNIEIEAHDAFSDIKATRQLISRMMQLIK